MSSRYVFSEVKWHTEEVVTLMECRLFERRKGGSYFVSVAVIAATLFVLRVSVLDRPGRRVAGDSNLDQYTN